MPEHSGLPWAECMEAGDYPVIIVDFEESDDDRPVTLFFDTGARHSYVSEKMLKDLGVEISSKHYLRHERAVGPLGSPTGSDRTALRSYYREKQLRVTITDGNLSYGGVARFRVVRNWESSSFAAMCERGNCAGSDLIEQHSRGSRFACGYRRGLVSASLVNDLNLEITIDGRNRTLRVMRLGDSVTPLRGGDPA